MTPTPIQHFWTPQMWTQLMLEARKYPQAEDEVGNYLQVSRGLITRSCMETLG